MKKLILLTAALATISTAASAYSTQGVTVENGDCNVYSNPNQDRHYWIPKLALREFTVADSIDYHEARTDGNNFNAAALCWMNDRGNALVHMDNGGDNDNNWHYLGFDGISANALRITSMSYGEKIDFLNSTNNYIVNLPNTFERIGNSDYTMQGIIHYFVDGVTAQDVVDAWIGLMQQEWSSTYEGFGEPGNGFLDQYKAAWEAAAGSYVAAVPESETTETTYPTPLTNATSWGATEENLETFISTLKGLGGNHNIYMDDNPNLIVVTVSGSTVVRPITTTTIVEGSPAMYGGYPLTDWTDSLGITG